MWSDYKGMNFRLIFKKMSKIDRKRDFQNALEPFHAGPIKTLQECFTDIF